MRGVPATRHDAATMIRCCFSALRPSKRHGLPETPLERESRPAEVHFAYGRPFWMAYTSNWLLMVGVSLLFRYADFVTLLGGTEFHLGWIVGVGMVGSLAMRLSMGSCIDRYGSRMVWLGSTILFAATCLAHLAITSHTGLAIYALRILFCCALAGIFGASMTFVSHQAPQRRMAELIGMLGTAGFLGAVVGTVLGDFLFGSAAVQRPQVDSMFVVAGLLGLLSFPFAWAATVREKRPRLPTGPRLLHLLRRHHPGTVLAVGVAMGMGLGLPGTFLRTFAADLDIPRISLFFTVYAAAAILTRILTRRWPERFGTRPLILLGMAGMVASLLLFLPVRAEWQLIVPAIGFGCSHAVLFPSVVAAGNCSFPAGNRGLATTLVLAAWDMGQLIGSPAAGVMLKYSEAAGLPPYPTMFLAMSGVLALVGAWYAAAGTPKGVGP